MADINERFISNICILCIKELAEECVSMDKMDDIGIGYTKAALDEGALQLMKCKGCGRFRGEIMLGVRKCCPSCFLYYLYIIKH